MKAQPLLSIVTPSFNQARFITENIESVLSQRYPRLEHIVVDGGSTDGTQEILGRYPHLKWTSERDRGQTNALNKGFKKATGEIVGWLNSDDTYCDDVFRRVVERFEDPSVMVVYGDGFEIDEGGKVLRPLISRGVSAEGLIRFWKWEYEFVQPAFFFRRGVFDEVGFLDESLYYAMDVDFFIRLAKRFRMEHLAYPVANLRYYSTSKTGAANTGLIPGYIWEMFAVSRRHWGSPWGLKFCGYLGSFVGALGLSVLKNLVFARGSKSREYVKRMLGGRREIEGG